MCCYYERIESVLMYKNFIPVAAKALQKEQNFPRDCAAPSSIACSDLEIPYNKESVEKQKAKKNNWQFRRNHLATKKGKTARIRSLV